MRLDAHDDETIRLLHHYPRRLDLPHEALRVTTDRPMFASWLGRRVSAHLGGAYVFLPQPREHAILIHLERIDRTGPRSLEVVVAEELLHMRDQIDGDLRRHAHHGYDRIAHRVAALTGASLEEIRSCLLPVQRHPLRYLYVCPRCQRQVWRRVRGTWSCGRCAKRFDQRFRLLLVHDRSVDGTAEGYVTQSR